MLRVFSAALLATGVMTFSSGESRAACGTFTLSSSAASHESNFNDMDANGEVSVGDSVVGTRTLNNAAGKTVAEMFFIGTVDAVSKQNGTARRSTKYVYEFSNGTVFGARDFNLPVASFRDLPPKEMMGHPNTVQIIGGSGAYANARGEVEFQLNDQGGAVYTFNFDCDLVGTWVGETMVALKSENKIVETPRIFTMVIEEVKGNLLKGVKTWRSPEDKDPGYIGNRLTTSASEPFIGALSSDGDTLRLVEVEDRGILIGEVLGPDEIEFTYMETAPHPVVYTVVYRRQK